MEAGVTQRGADRGSRRRPALGRPCAGGDEEDGQAGRRPVGEIVEAGALTHNDLGITATALEAIVPTYLQRFRPPAGQRRRLEEQKKEGR